MANWTLVNPQNDRSFVRALGGIAPKIQDQEIGIRCASVISEICQRTGIWTDWIKLNIVAGQPLYEMPYDEDILVSAIYEASYKVDDIQIRMQNKAISISYTGEADYPRYFWEENDSVRLYPTPKQDLVVNFNVALTLHSGAVRVPEYLLRHYSRLIATGIKYYYLKDDAEKYVEKQLEGHYSIELAQSQRDYNSMIVRLANNHRNNALMSFNLPKRGYG